MEEAKYHAPYGNLESSPTSVLLSPTMVEDPPSFISPDDIQELDNHYYYPPPTEQLPDHTSSSFPIIPIEEEDDKENNADAQSEDDSDHPSHLQIMAHHDDTQLSEGGEDSSDGLIIIPVHVRTNDDDTGSSVVSSEDPDSPNPTGKGKVVARPSPDDDSIPSSPSPVSKHKKMATLDQIVAKVPSPNYPARPFKAMHNIDLSRGQIDTAAPFESVKAAVSKFGGIVDWKAHREHTVERRKVIEQEMEKAQEERSTYKKQCEEAEEAKTQVQKDLNHTNMFIEELKIKLEMAHQEEEKAKQGAQQAKLRVEEMERGIADGTSVTAKAQLEVARAKHTAALAELNAAKDLLQQVQKQHASLLAEKEEAVQKIEEAETASREAEESIKEMAVELVTLKQSLEPARSAYRDVDELRIEAVIAQELDNLTWEEEMNLPRKELGKLNEQMLSTKDVRTRLGDAMELLHRAKIEMTDYMESESADAGKDLNLEDMLMESKKNSHKDIETAVTAAKKELAEVDQKIEKATEEVNTLKVSATALKSELDKERSELAAIHRREKAVSSAFKLLEAEVNTIKSEITLVQMKAVAEKGEAVEDLPKRIQLAAEEADQAKTLAQTAQSALEKAKEEADQARTEATAMESSLQAAQQEIEAARASEKLAQATINVLAKNKFSLSNNNEEEDSANQVTLSVEEYYELTKRVHKAEEQANTRVAAALSQVEAAKESKSKNFNRLEEVKREIASRREALKLALQKAEKAEEEKMAVEQELEKLKIGQKEETKAVESVPEPSESSAPSFEESQNAVSLPASSGLHQRSTPGTYTVTQTETSKITPELSTNTKIVPARKKKRSFFPRFFMFLFKRKSPSSKKIA